MKNWDYGKLAIATAAILGVLTLGALIYLLLWYVRRGLRARRLRRQEKENDQFDQSAVSLAEDTSRTLDHFLMKDIQPERSSIIFSRSRSPSINIVIDDADANRCKSSPQPYLTEHHTAASSSAVTHVLSQISTQKSGPDDPRTQWSSSGQRSSSTTPRASTSSSVVPASQSSQVWTTTSGSTPSEQTQSVSAQHSSTTTPRASISSSVVPTAGSSQVWTTTSAETETFSLLSQSSNYSHHPQSPIGPSTSRSSQIYTRRSNASAASSRPSSGGILQSASRMFNEAEAARMAYSRNIDSVGSMSPTSPVSPVLVDVSADNKLPQWTSVPPTPFPFSQLWSLMTPSGLFELILLICRWFRPDEDGLRWIQVPCMTRVPFLLFAFPSNRWCLWKSMLLIKFSLLIPLIHYVQRPGLF